jgi:hypothetical protein
MGDLLLLVLLAQVFGGRIVEGSATYYKLVDLVL